MKKLALSLRSLFFVLAVVATVVGFSPAETEAVKSCEYYCGPAGPYQCLYSPSFLNCSTYEAP